MSLFLAGQIVGGIAVLISIAIYQVDDRRKMLALASTAAMLYALSFFMIHAYTGAILNFIGGIRTLTFMRSKSSSDSLKIYCLFGFMSALGTYITWAGPLSLLALAGTLMSALSSGQLSTKLMRRAGLLAPPLWFSYNLLTRSYPGMFIEIFVVCSNFIGQYRFDLKRSKNILQSETD
jgi:hypothetical protein